MTIDDKFISLRVRTRKNSKVVVDHLVKYHIVRGRQKPRSKKEICIFCSSNQLLTKEHVLPRWTFENNTERFFITEINGLGRTYNRTTVPSCSTCNNELLGYLESYIVQLFKTADLAKGFFSDYDLQNIIRWLEIIEYKFQVLDMKRQFITSKTGGYIPYLTDFPLAVLTEKVGSPSKAVSQVRLAQKRVTIKSKKEKINSLVIFQTKNRKFYFFHTPNEFIYLELPQYRIAMFYFYSKNFKNNFNAFNAAMKIIKKVYTG